MSRYTVKKQSRQTFWLKALVIAVVLAAVVLFSAVFIVRRTYEHNLLPVNTSEQSHLFTVAPGDTPRDIGASLQDQGLIRAAWAFEWYVRTNGAHEYLKAGTYKLQPNLSVPQIVEILTEGEIATDLITILPQKTLLEIQESFVDKYGFSDNAVEVAFRPANYSDHPALVDKPIGASLEGYIYPESFEKTTETTPEEVIGASLDQMQKHLTPQIREGIARQGLTVYQGIILASIIENEVDGPEDRRKVAQVFLRRLKENRRLESDAARYTYSNAGLPSSPISNVTSSSLEAVANPASTDFLYFVSGDDGRTYFSHTLEQHEALTKQHCIELCQ